MITFLTSPKSFDAKNGPNQIRAIQSWLAVAPDVEVLVYGKAERAEAVCRELKVIYIPDINSTESGLPYFNSIVDHAQTHATHNTQIYLNCDILLNHTLAQAIQQIPFSPYLMIGQRIDLSQGVVIDLSSRNWLDILSTKARKGQITLHPPTGKDYFVFQRGMWAELPEVVIGRGGYDSALLAHCLKRRIPIVDVTFSVAALHQFHDYAHTTGGKDEVMRGKDAQRNRQNSGILHSAPTIADAQWILRDNQLRANACRGDRLRALEISYRFEKRQEALGLAIRALWRTLRRIGLLTTKESSLSEVLGAWNRLREPEERNAN